MPEYELLFNQFGPNAPLFPPSTGEVAAPAADPSIAPAIEPVDARGLRATPLAPYTGVRLTLDGVDITPYVRGLSWRLGSLSPNRIGEVMTPGRMEVLLDNGRGEFTPINPNVSINTSPGARVILQYVGAAAAAAATRTGAQAPTVLFTGFSKGIVAREDGSGADIANMSCESIFGRVSEVSDGVFIRLSGRPTTAEVLSEITTNIEIPPYLVDVTDTGYAERVNTARVNLQAGIGSNRRRARMLDAFQLVAILEGGRIYETRIGGIRFDASFGRGYSHHRGTDSDVEIKAVDIRDVSYLPFDHLIVNEIEGFKDEYVSAGVQRMDEFADDLSLPQTNLRILPGTGDYQLRLRLRPGKYSFIESVEPLERGKHYDYTLSGVDPIVENRHDGIYISFPNPTSDTQTASLHYLDVEPFKTSWGYNLALRDAASVGTYGAKTAQFPFTMFEDVEAARARAALWLEQYKGYDTETDTPHPTHAIRVRLRNWDVSRGVFDISQLVKISYEMRRAGFKKEVFRDKHFWVRAVAHTIDSDGVWDTELTLIEASKWARRIVSPTAPGDVVELPPDIPNVFTPLWTVSAPEAERIYEPLFVDVGAPELAHDYELLFSETIPSRYELLFSEPLPKANRFAPLFVGVTRPEIVGPVTVTGEVRFSQVLAGVRETNPFVELFSETAPKANVAVLLFQSSGIPTDFQLLFQEAAPKANVYALLFDGVTIPRQFVELFDVDAPKPNEYEYLFREVDAPKAVREYVVLFLDETAPRPTAPPPPPPPTPAPTYVELFDVDAPRATTPLPPARPQYVYLFGAERPGRRTGRLPGGRT